MPDIKVTPDTSYFATMEQLIEFQEMAEGRKIKTYMQFIADHKLIKDWSFASSPHDVNSLLALNPKEWRVVDKAVSEAITAIFQD